MKKIYFLIICFFLTSCGGFEFAYDNPINVDIIKGKTYLDVSGDNSETVFSYLVSRIDNNQTDYIYKLSVKSSKIVEARVVETDATASKFSIKFNIEYNLSKGACGLIGKKIASESSFYSKSAGYSFGTDLSEGDATNKNIYSNVDDFLYHVVTSGVNLDKC